MSIQAKQIEGNVNDKHQQQNRGHIQNHLLVHKNVMLGNRLLQKMQSNSEMNVPMSLMAHQ